MRDPDCEKCLLSQRARTVCMWGHGGRDGFIVGEAPGKEEDVKGKPFVGSSGKLIRRVLAEAGLEDPYFTNTVKCHPPKNRKPEPDEIRSCKGYLEDEVSERKPKAILLLGAVAMKAMIGKTGITSMNGQVVEKNGQTFVCCFHPAYILRDPSKEEDLKMAVHRYVSVLRGTHDPSMPAWKAVDADTLDEFVQSFSKAERVSFDIETTGLEWWTEGFGINSIAFTLSDHAGTYEESWGLPLMKSPILPFEVQREFLKELSRTCAGKYVFGQFAKFDNLCLMRVYGVQFYISSDNGLAHHLIDENSDHGLKILSRRFCGAPDYDLTLKEKKGRTSIKKLLSYNCADTAYTDRCERQFTQKMDEQEEWLFRKVIIPAARVFERIEAGGLYVDLDRMEKIGAEIETQLSEVEAKLNRIAKQPVNWKSPPQVAEVLYRKLKIKPTVFTDKINPETGERDTPSTGEEALVSIDHPIREHLIKYRELEKFLSTYIGRKTEGGYVGGWRDYMVGPHLYLSTKLHGTVTGRFSSRLHQVPRDGTVRNMVIAPPGWTFMQMDLSQAELRVIAIISRDPELLRCFQVGEDVHWRTLMGAVLTGGGEYVQAIWETAKRVTKKKMDFAQAVEVVRSIGPDRGVELWDGWKEGRKKAKGINFGFAYGQSEMGFINYAKLKYGFEPTLEESSQFRNSFFDTYREIQNWHERQKQLVKMDGFVRSLSGRKRRLPGIYSSDRSVVAECERQAINSPVQGFIGDYKTMIMVELDQTLPQDAFQLKGEVHDSVLAWIKDEHLDWVVPQVRAISESPRLAKECGLNFPIKLSVDIELGPWGAGKKWKG